MVYNSKTEEFVSALKEYQCVGVYIDIKKDLPVTAHKEYQTGKKPLVANLIDLINAEDLMVVLTRIEELSSVGSGSLRINCRFVPENKQYLICCEMRREKRLGKTIEYLFGVIMDVAEFNKNMESDPAQQELMRLKKNMEKFSALNPKSNDTGIVEIIGMERLAKIQIPLSDIPGLNSAIFTESGKFICSADSSQNGFDAHRYKHSRQVYIKIKTVIYAVWVIASDDALLIERYSAAHDVLADTLSNIANSYVLLYNEMVNTEHANKMLSETIEQQMLLSGIYNKVLNERNTVETMRAIINLTGEFLKLDRIMVYENIISEEKYRFVYEWGTAETAVMAPPEFAYLDYKKLIDELSSYETYFSSNPEHNVLGIDFSSYVASNLNGDGSNYGIIIYLINDKARVLTHAEKRLLRSISQIIAAVIMRCKDNEQLDITTNRLRDLAYRDQKLGIKNRTSLGIDVNEALESGQSGAVIAFRIPQIKNINKFEGHDYTDNLLIEVLNTVSGYDKVSVEPYRFSGKVFMFLLRGADKAAVKEFCDATIKRFEEPWSVEGQIKGMERYLGVAMGVALYPDTGETAEELYRTAEISMYKAKEYGVKSYAFYSDVFEPRRDDDYYCSQLLREAVENNMSGIVVEYLPVYSTSTNTDESATASRKIVSYEALPTLSQPINSQTYPSHLMTQIAEKLGIDAIINTWLIKCACEFCVRARAENPETTVSISVSAHALASGEIVAMVNSALEQTKLPAENLILQFSERIIAINYERFIVVLGELKKIGTPVILDNIGSYYTMSSIVRHSGISGIKADLNFLVGGFDECNDAYVEGLIKLAKEKGVSIGARSVESESQLNVGMAKEVNWYQGGFYSKAISEEEAITKVAELSLNP